MRAAALQYRSLLQMPWPPCTALCGGYALPCAVLCFAMVDRHVDLSQVHYLSGPIRVTDADGVPAKPGACMMSMMAARGRRPGVVVQSISNSLCAVLTCAHERCVRAAGGLQCYALWPRAGFRGCVDALNAHGGDPWVTGAGDLLVVELCNLGPLPGDEWGFTGGQLAVACHAQQC